VDYRKAGRTAGIFLVMKIADPRVEENLLELASALAQSNDAGLIKDFLRCL